MRGFDINAATAYDEDADGFQFARTRSKNVTAAPTAKHDDTTSAENASAPAPATAPMTGKRKRQLIEKSTRAQSPPEKRRRSARLSGEPSQAEDPHVAPVLIQETTRKAQKPETKQTGKSKEYLPLREALKPPEIRKPTKIALPFADTPIIVRNKEMRKNTGQGQGHRRSSAGMRGRRASSLIESGTSNGEDDERFEATGLDIDAMHVALPHAEVEAVEFYKHISQDLAEPRRMRQLLTWCATRALLPSSAEGISESEDVRIGMHVCAKE